MKILIDDERDIRDVTHGDDEIIIARSYDMGILLLERFGGECEGLYLDYFLGSGTDKTGGSVMEWLEENPNFLPKDIDFVTNSAEGRVSMYNIYKRICKKHIDKAPDYMYDAIQKEAN